MNPTHLLERARRAAPGALRRRLIAATGLASAVAAVVLVVTTHLVLDRAGDATVRRVLAERADAIVATLARTSDDADDAAPAVGPYDVLYDDRGRRVAGAVPESFRFPGLADAFARLDRARSERYLDIGETYRLLARPVEVEGRRGVLVLAESLAVYEGDEDAALWLSIVTGTLLVALSMTVAAWISRRALAPVQEMASTAREWSERDLERRFDLGAPTDEIRALGQVLDELLEKVAAAIRAEQRLTAEMAHELRSPLTTIRATADLMALHPDLDEQLREDVADIVAACTTMSTTITVLLELARAGHTGDRDGCTGAQLAEDVRALAAARDGGRLDVDLPPRLVIAAPRVVVLRAIGPLVDNALRAGERVQVTAAVRSGRAVVTVADDGPGVDDEVADRIFEPGAGTTGSGLGLALARRVAHACGGDVDLVRARGGPLGGASFALDLPGHLS
ncbi:ATP-binding protein [Nocardioides sp.]|uniref:sensor histidine kinase n=1 Tax=Nocardioides sp. TaxID=35761 RepID=UPI003518CDB6